MTTPLMPRLIQPHISDTWSICPNCQKVGHVSGCVGLRRETPTQPVPPVGTVIDGQGQIVATSQGKAFAIFTVGGHNMVCPKCGLVCRTCGLGYFECVCPE